MTVIRNIAFASMMLFSLSARLWATELQEGVSLQCDELTEEMPQLPSGFLPFCAVTISGAITEGTLTKWKVALDSANKKGGAIGIVYLNSAGGRVDIAYTLAAELRVMKIHTHVPLGSVCLSSCVVILAGGLVRSSDGVVGIHRPFFESGANDIETARRAYSVIGSSLEKFFREGGVRESLWSEMVSTPPENIRYLSANELTFFGLIGTDPAYSEVVAKREMERYQISREVYNARKAALSECSNIVLTGAGQGLNSESLVTLRNKCRENIMRNGTLGPTARSTSSLQDAFSAYDRQDYATALRFLLPIAEQGHASAQFNLGLMYDQGQGVPEDDQQAVAWYRKAADQGHASAQYNLGVMYSYGLEIGRAHV